MRRFKDQNCSIAQALEVLGDWWTLLVVRDAFVVFQQAFIKPRHSMAFAGRYGVKALGFTTRSEAQRRLTEVWQAGHEVVLQEYIPGPPTRHYMLEGFVDRSGRVLAWCVRRRLRMYPEDYGDSSWMVTVPLRDVAAAAETLTRLFSALRYRGVFEAEFKHDERDGAFRLAPSTSGRTVSKRMAATPTSGSRSSSGQYQWCSRTRTAVVPHCSSTTFITSRLATTPPW